MVGYGPIEGLSLLFARPLSVDSECVEAIGNSGRRLGMIETAHIWHSNARVSDSEKSPDAPRMTGRGGRRGLLKAVWTTFHGQAPSEARHKRGTLAQKRRRASRINLTSPLHRLDAIIAG